MRIAVTVLLLAALMLAVLLVLALARV